MSYVCRLTPAVQRRSDGEGANFVFIHGWGSDNRLWHDLRTHLPGNHYGVELPGFGSKSGATPLALEDFLTAVQQDLPSASVLVGWSLGGMLATRLAERCPERVKALITLATNPCFVAQSQWPSAMAEPTFAQFSIDFERNPTKTWGRFHLLQAQGDRDKRSVLAQLKQQPEPGPAQLASWRQSLAWLQALDNRLCVAQLAQPQLHILGQHDALVPASVATELAVSGASVSIVAEAGHCPHLTRSDEVAAGIVDWMQAHKPAVTGPATAKRHIARSFGGAARTYDGAAQVQALAAKQLLAWMPRSEPQDVVLDLGCGTGRVTQLMLQHARELPFLVHLDLALGMVQAARAKLAHSSVDARWIAADGDHLPFAEQALDGVLSNFALQWCPDLARVANEVHRALKPGGWFLFTTLGPGTLYELKTAWQTLDAYAHVNRFIDDGELSRKLEANGFRVEQLRRESFVEQHQNLMVLLKSLRAIGTRNVNLGRNPGFTSRRQLRQLEQRYQLYQDDLGLLPATYDVFFVLARKPYE